MSGMSVTGSRGAASAQKLTLPPSTFSSGLVFWGAPAYGGATAVGLVGSAVDSVPNFGLPLSVPTSNIVLQAAGSANRAVWNTTTGLNGKPCIESLDGASTNLTATSNVPAFGAGAHYVWLLAEFPCLTNASTNGGVFEGDFMCLGNPAGAGAGTLHYFGYRTQVCTVWAASTTYEVGADLTPFIIYHSGNNYLLTTPGISASSGGPTGTGGAIVDGSCVWKFICVAANASSRNEFFSGGGTGGQALNFARPYGGLQLLEAFWDGTSRSLAINGIRFPTDMLTVTDTLNLTGQFTLGSRNGTKLPALRIYDFGVVSGIPTIQQRFAHHRYLRSLFSRATWNTAGVGVLIANVGNSNVEGSAGAVNGAGLPGANDRDNFYAVSNCVGRVHTATTGEAATSITRQIGNSDTFTTAKGWLDPVAGLIPRMSGLYRKVICILQASIEDITPDVDSGGPGGGPYTDDPAGHAACATNIIQPLVAATHELSAFADVLGWRFIEPFSLINTDPEEHTRLAVNPVIAATAPMFGAVSLDYSTDPAFSTLNVASAFYGGTINSIVPGIWEPAAPYHLWWLLDTDGHGTPGGTTYLGRLIYHTLAGRF